jgi:hypothetical protein
MLARQQTVTDDRVLIHADQAAGFADATALGNVGEDGDDFLLRQAGVEQRGALALGKTSLASLAIQQAALLPAVAGTHGEIAVAALAVVGTVRVLAAEGREVVHDVGRSNPSKAWSEACSCCRKPEFAVQ